MAIHPPDEQLYETARAQFAYFDASAKRPAFMENAGGSQVPNAVIDAIADYMRTRLRPPRAGRPFSHGTRQPLSIRMKLYAAVRLGVEGSHDAVSMLREM